ncbi:MAG: MFS transporter [Rhizobiales bacterium]|nr:MFS transporter [Hyphomicrobiales bacterium]
MTYGACLEQNPRPALAPALGCLSDNRCKFFCLKEIGSGKACSRQLIPCICGDVLLHNAHDGGAQILTTTKEEPAPKATPNDRMVLYVSLIGMLATGFSFTILTVAVGMIGTEFGVSKGVATWAVSAPMLISAVSLPMLGKLGDVFGHRRIFLIGIIGSTIFAGASFLAWDIWSLIIFRVLSMFFAGATGPSSLALIFHVYDLEDRTRAVSWWSMGGPASAAIGLILGGPLVDLWGWRSVFMFQLVTGIISWAFAYFYLPETTRRRAIFDHIGNLILVVALVMLLLSAGSLSDDAIPDWVKLVGAIAGLFGVGLFLLYETQAAHPILPPSLLRAKNFSAPVITSFFIQVAYLGGLVATPMVLIDHFKYSVSIAAGLMLVRTAFLTVASPASGYLSTRYGERFTTFLGIYLQAAGLFLVATGVYETSIFILLVGLMLQGTGSGFVLPPTTSVISSAVPPSLFGTASGVSRLVMQTGASLGLSLFGALLSYPREIMSLPLIFAIGSAVTLMALPSAMVMTSISERR